MTTIILDIQGWTDRDLYVSHPDLCLQHGSTLCKPSALQLRRRRGSCGWRLPVTSKASKSTSFAQSDKDDFMESPYQHLFCVDTEVWWRCSLVNDQSDAKFVPGDSQLYTWGCRNIGCGVPLRHTIWNQWKLIVSFSLKRTSYMTSNFHGLSTFSRPKFHGLS